MNSLRKSQGRKALKKTLSIAAGKKKWSSLSVTTTEVQAAIYLSKVLSNRHLRVRPATAAANIFKYLGREGVT